MVFGYANGLQDVYRDPSQQVLNGSQQYGGQTFWSYINQYEDLNTGVGANISYARAFGNTHGTPYTTSSQGTVTDDRLDPLYCTNQANNSDTSKQCIGAYLHPEDYSWSQEVVTQISALGTDSSGNTTVATTSYHYALTAVPADHTPVSSCNPLTGSGVPAQEADCVMDNWSPGYNGTQTSQHDADWQDYYHSEFRGFNVVYTTSAAGNLTVDFYFSTEGWWFPQSDGLDYNGGQLYQEDVYQGNTATPDALLRETVNSYTGVPGSPYSGVDSCNGTLHPVYNPCVPVPLETKTMFSQEWGNLSNAPWVDTKFTYDDINPSTGYVPGGYHNLLQEVISSSNASTITRKWTYNHVIQDHVGVGQYVLVYDVDQVAHSEIDDASGHVWGCQDTTYDEGMSTPTAGWPTTTTNYSTCGNASTALKNYTAYDQYGNVVATIDPLAVANPGLYSSQGCTLGTAPVEISVAWTAGRYTSCVAYDTTHTAGLPVSSTNALGQGGSVSYDYTSGALPTSSVDANGQTTSYGYAFDGSGNETITAKAPGESGSYTTRQVENSQCSGNSTLPCYEIDSNSLLYSSAISRTYYDALGRAVETRTPGPTPGDDTVVMTVYNDQNNSVFQSVPFQVPDGSAWLDPATAKDINGHAPAGSVTFADALGRPLATQDPNFGSAQEPGLNCSPVLDGNYTCCTNYWVGHAINDANAYIQAETDNATDHQSSVFTDALGRTVYTQTYGGSASGVTNEQTVIQYNALDKPISVSAQDWASQPNQSITSVTTTMTYDDMGRLLTLTDPDQGTFSYGYDADSQVITTTQTSGSNSRTVGINYDLLGRVGCEQTAAPTINATGACSAGSPLVVNTYDTTVLGTRGSTDFPVGQLTKSVASTYYPDGTSASVTNLAQHDQRGRTITAQMQVSLPTAWNVTTALPTYQLTQAYNDADQPTTTSTQAGGTAGYTFTQVYNATNGSLQGLSNNGNATANLATLSYNANALLSQLTFQASTGTSGLANEQFSYDGDLRPTGTSAVWLSSSGQSGTLFNQSTSYDNAGNVTSLTTTQAQVQGQSVSGGSQTENFCYDAQNHLLWAGNTGTQPGAGSGTCGSGTLSNTLAGSSASYNNAYTYTDLGQIWTAPIDGSTNAKQYLYCDSTHPHQLTGVYEGGTCSSKSTAIYTATYDPWGNVNSFNLWSGWRNDTLSYDTFNHLVSLSDSGSGNSEQYLYDAGGERVLKRSTASGVTSMTVYAFGLEEYQYHGDGSNMGGTSNTHYYSLGGLLLGKFDGTSTTFYLSDGLGSVVASFSNTANSAAVPGNQTYEPYGKTQYQQGSMGTSKGYTGQYADTASGLDYYNARYYLPDIGVFLSPDSVQGNAQGMDPYSYVASNPETMADPTGHMFCNTCVEAGGSVSGGNAILSSAFPNGIPGYSSLGLQDPANLGTSFEANGVTWTEAPNGAITRVTATSGLQLYPGNPGYEQLQNQYNAALQASNDDPGRFAVNRHILTKMGINEDPRTPTGTGTGISTQTQAGGSQSGPIAQLGGSGGPGGPPKGPPTNVTPPPPGGDNNCNKFYRFVRQGQEPGSYRAADFQPKDGMVQTGMGTSLITRGHPLFQRFAGNPKNLAYEVELSDLQLPEGMEIIPDGPNHAMIGFTESVSEDVAKQSLQQISGWGDPCQGTDL